MPVEAQLQCLGITVKNEIMSGDNSPAGRESITESILLWKSDPVIFLLSKFHGKEEDAHGKDNNERTGAGAAAWHQPA